MGGGGVNSHPPLLEQWYRLLLSAAASRDQALQLLGLAILAACGSHPLSPSTPHSTHSPPTTTATTAAITTASATAAPAAPTFAATGQRGERANSPAAAAVRAWCALSHLADLDAPPPSAPVCACVAHLFTGMVEDSADWDAGLSREQVYLLLLQDCAQCTE